MRSILYNLVEFYIAMRLLLSFFVIFLLVSSSLYNFVLAENQQDRFTWNESRPLKWSDFRGTPGILPPDFKRSYEIAAFTLTWNESQWRFEKTSSVSCQYKITQMNVPAYFLPYESWVKPEHKSDYLLEHEQGHFDIAEIYDRQFRVLQNQVFPCPGGTFDVSKINAELDQKWTDNIKQMNDLNKQYDQETDGSQDKTKQAQWNAKLQSLLATSAQLYDTSAQQGSSCPVGYPFLWSDGYCYDQPESNYLSNG